MSAKKKASNFEVRDVADELMTRIRDHEGSFDEDFRLAFARHVYAKWLGTPREITVAEEVAELLRAELKCGVEELSYDWWLTSSENHKVELIDQQESLVNEIDENKAERKADATTRH